MAQRVSWICEILGAMINSKTKRVSKIRFPPLPLKSMEQPAHAPLVDVGRGTESFAVDRDRFRPASKEHCATIQPIDEATTATELGPLASQLCKDVDERYSKFFRRSVGALSLGFSISTLLQPTSSMIHGGRESDIHAKSYASGSLYGALEHEPPRRLEFALNSK